MSDVQYTSIVENQVPSFVRDDHPNFVLFVKKYYEWMERSNNIVGLTQTLKDAKDVDLLEDTYMEKALAELLPSLPQEILLDKTKFIKHVSQFYRSKGTPESLKFLFRILYNENIEIYFPKEQVLKISDGKWALPLALRVETGDENIFQIEKTKITGTNSKATAVVESVVRSIDRQLGVQYIELYVSNVDKYFQTGENVYTTLVSTNGSSSVVTAKLIGSLSEIKIDPNNRGLFYNGYDTTIPYQGDPVTIVGGLNPTSANPIGAYATVGDVLTGSVNRIEVINGGFGFRDPSVNTNSSIVDFSGGFLGGNLGAEAKARILLLNTTQSRTLNVSNYTLDGITTLSINSIDNLSNTKTINELTTKQQLEVFPISYITVDSSGGGYKTKPNVEVYSMYMEDVDDSLIINSTTAFAGSDTISDSTKDLRNYFEVGERVKLFLKNKFEEVKVIKQLTSNTLTFLTPFENRIDNLEVYKLLRRNLTDVGSLGRIQIVSGGIDYEVGEYLTFTTNGRGYGANAQITEVHTGNSGIKTIEFNETDAYIKGGEGYTIRDLPTISVNTANGTGADLYVSEILGDGEDIELSTTRIGAISNIRVVSYGYDYTSAPSVSLRNADLGVANVTSGQIFVSNTRIYQGISNAATTWYAYVDQYSTTTNILRIFDYRGTLNTQLQIVSDNGLVSANVISETYYGDGRAKATANFENGLIRYPGVYLNTDGQPSSDQKFQDGERYHNYSYVVNTENDYFKFKKTLNDLVHPLGTKAFVTRIDTNSGIAVNNSSELITLSINTLVETFNIANGSNNMVATGVFPTLSTVVSANDIITLKNVVKSIIGVANLTANSNVLTGNGTNFINDLQDGQTLMLSSGNVVTIQTVANATSIILSENINVTETDVTMNVMFDETKTVNFVNTDMILVDTNFTSDNTYVTATLQKVE